MQRLFPLFLICLLNSLSLLAQPKTNAAFLNDPSFEENRGQLTGTDAARVTYSYRNGGLSVFLMKTGLVYQFVRVHSPDRYRRPFKGMPEAEREKMPDLQKQARTETYRMDMELIGANPQAVVTAEEPAAGYVNYYNKDVMQVRSYAKIIYHDIYPHIDWIIYRKDDHLKYDFAVRPGGNPADIRICTRHVENLQLQPDGGLRMSCRMGEITEQKPVSYQDGKEVATRFIRDDRTISFDVAGYRHDQVLTIDPTLVWATYYGGSAGETANGCAVDRFGNVYIAGTTNSASGIADGGFQNTIGSGTADAYLAKFNAAGVRQWATYYGGNVDQEGEYCTTDALGNVYLAGRTASTSGIASGGHQNVHAGGNDAYLVKFDATGTRLWGTYYGGVNYDAGTSCVTDVTGNVYLSGITMSGGNIATVGAHQEVFGGDKDGFIVKFSPSGVRLWATYYGTGADDQAVSCATDTSKNVYLCGRTNSSSGLASGGHQNTPGGGGDAFLAKFNKDGNLQWATYYGGDSADVGQTCATDAIGNVYMGGLTTSDTGIAFNGYKDTVTWNDGFLVKFNKYGVRQWGTYYGGSELNGVASCAVSEYGNVYIAGVTTASVGVASGGYQNTKNGWADAYLAKFDTDGHRQWGTYYGGVSVADEGGRACAVYIDDVFLAGLTNSSSGIASGGHQNTFAGALDGFLVKFYDPCPPVLTVTPDNDSVCIGTPVTFTAVPANGGSAPSYQWKVNGVNVGSNAPTYTYTPAYGDVVTCELSGPNACNTTTATGNPVAMYVDTGAVAAVSVSATPAVNVPPGAPVAYIASVANAASYTLDWYVNGTFVLSTNSPNNLYVRNMGFAPDTIQAVLKPRNGCYNDTVYSSNSVTVSIATGVSPVNHLPGLSVYPNPTDGRLHVTLAAGTIRNVELLNMLGQPLPEVVKGNGTLDLAALPAGLYHLRLIVHKDGRDCLVVQKVEKR